MGYIKEKEYIESRHLVESVSSYFNNKNLTLTRLPNGIQKDSEGFESAVGNYTNFLRVRDIFFFPVYGNREQDQNAVDALIKVGIKVNNIVRVPDCAELAELGGVLNCITTHIYS